MTHAYKIYQCYSHVTSDIGTRNNGAHKCECICVVPSSRVFVSARSAAGWIGSCGLVFCFLFASFSFFNHYGLEDRFAVWFVVDSFVFCLSSDGSLLYHVDLFDCRIGVENCVFFLLRLKKRIKDQNFS